MLRLWMGSKHNFLVCMVYSGKMFCEHRCVVKNLRMLFLVPTMNKCCGEEHEPARFCSILRSVVLTIG